MIAEIHFKTYAESVAHIKWLRATLNDRGSDWDFAYSKKANKVMLVINDPKIITWYRLQFPQASMSHGSSLR